MTIWPVFNEWKILRMKLSVITVNLNCAAGLLRTVESVVNQTYSDFEYIIIDGGSTDGSVEVIKKYDNKITYWISEPDNGIYNAMNKGIRHANGEYCFFLNSDDLLYSNETLSQVFKSNDRNDIIYGNINITSSKKKWVQKQPADLSFINFYNGGICHQAAFIKRNLFEKFGYYNESFKLVSDWQFFLRTIVFSNISVKYIDQIISDINGEGFGYQNPQIMIAERQKVLEENFPALVLKDYERFSNNYEDIQFLIDIKDQKVFNYAFRVLKKTIRLIKKCFPS